MPSTDAWFQNVFIAFAIVYVVLAVVRIAVQWKNTNALVKLKLSQRQAGHLFKVGENAFDKYERGLVAPSGPTIQLMHLLDKHPNLVDELG